MTTLKEAWDAAMVGLDDCYIRPRALTRRNAEAAIRALAQAVADDFVANVNRLAEEEMLRTGTLEGAHHRGIQAYYVTLAGEIQQLGERETPVP